MEEIGAFLKLINEYGTLPVILVILVLGARQVWVWGWTYRQALADLAFYREIAFRATGVGEKLAEVAKQKGAGP